MNLLSCTLQYCVCIYELHLKMLCFVLRRLHVLLQHLQTLGLDSSDPRNGFLEQHPRPA